MNDNLTTNASNEAENPAFLVGAVSGSINKWTNEFNDRVIYQGTHLDKGGHKKCYSIYINDKYIVSLGSINLSKGFVNKERKSKCKWIGSVI